jgi:hypothetical protein
MKDEWINLIIVLESYTEDFSAVPDVGHSYGPKIWAEMKHR